MNLYLKKPMLSRQVGIYLINRNYIIPSLYEVVLSTVKYLCMFSLRFLIIKLLLFYSVTMFYIVFSCTMCYTMFKYLIVFKYETLYLYVKMYQLCIQELKCSFYISKTIIYSCIFKRTREPHIFFRFRFRF